MFLPACEVASNSAYLVASRLLVSLLPAPIIYAALNKKATNVPISFAVLAICCFFSSLLIAGIIFVDAFALDGIDILCANVGLTTLHSSWPLTTVFVIFSFLHKQEQAIYVAIPIILALTVLFSIVSLWSANVKAGKEELKFEIERRLPKLAAKEESILTEIFPTERFMKIPHQQGVRFVHELFERSADRYPHSIALKIAGRLGAQLTYTELDERANQIAWTLEDLVVSKDSVVACILDRTVNLFAAHLAIMKSGGAILMVDPVLPTSTVLHMLKDANACAVITNYHTINPDHLLVVEQLMGRAVINTNDRLVCVQFFSVSIFFF